MECCFIYVYSQYFLPNGFTCIILTDYLVAIILTDLVAIILNINWFSCYNIIILKLECRFPVDFVIFSYIAINLYINLGLDFVGANTIFFFYKLLY